MVFFTIDIKGVMLDIYVTPDFDKLMKKAKLDDQAIIEAASELSNGLHDGDLDMGKLFKKRIASPNQSKRDSNRSIVAVQQGNKFFLLTAGVNATSQKRARKFLIN